MPKKAGKGLLQKGAHIVRRKAIDPGGDPYLNRQPPEEMSLCTGCGAVYHDKRWYKRQDLPAALAGRPNSASVLCPGCQKSKDNYPEGYLTIEGSFASRHGEEILGLIRNKEDRQLYINPLEQIIEVLRYDDRIEVRTTTGKLAQRLGRVLQKSYSGQISYKWSEDTRLARVVWRRDDP